MEQKKNKHFDNIFRNFFGISYFCGRGYQKSLRNGFRKIFEKNNFKKCPLHHKIFLICNM